MDQDIYGHPISVHYKGSDSYKTVLGALCTVATYVLIAVNFVTLLTAFNDGSNQDEKSRVNYFDNYKTEDYFIKDHEFDASIFVYPPMPINVGKIVAY